MPLTLNELNKFIQVDRSIEGSALRISRLRVSTYLDQFGKIRDPFGPDGDLSFDNQGNLLYRSSAVKVDTSELEDINTETAQIGALSFDTNIISSTIGITQIEDIEFDANKLSSTNLWLNDIIITGDTIGSNTGTINIDAPNTVFQNKGEVSNLILGSNTKKKGIRQNDDEELQVYYDGAWRSIFMQNFPTFRLVVGDDQSGDYQNGSIRYSDVAETFQFRQQNDWVNLKDFVSSTDPTLGNYLFDQDIIIHNGVGNAIFRSNNEIEFKPETASLDNDPPLTTLRVGLSDAELHSVLFEAGGDISNVSNLNEFELAGLGEIKSTGNIALTAVNNLNFNIAENNVMSIGSALVNIEQDINMGGNDINAVSAISGNVGTINFSGNILSNIAEPVDGLDAVNRDYVNSRNIRKLGDELNTNIVNINSGIFTLYTFANNSFSDVLGNGADVQSVNASIGDHLGSSVLSANNSTNSANIYINGMTSGQINWSIYISLAIFFNQGSDTGLLFGVSTDNTFNNGIYLERDGIGNIDLVYSFNGIKTIVNSYTEANITSTGFAQYYIIRNKDTMRFIGGGSVDETFEIEIPHGAIFNFYSSYTLVTTLTRTIITIEDDSLNDVVKRGEFETIATANADTTDASVFPTTPFLDINRNNVRNINDLQIAGNIETTSTIEVFPDADIQSAINEYDTVIISGNHTIDTDILINRSNITICGKGRIESSTGRCFIISGAVSDITISGLTLTTSTRVAGVEGLLSGLITVLDELDQSNIKYIGLTIVANRSGIIHDNTAGSISNMVVSNCHITCTSTEGYGIAFRKKINGLRFTNNIVDLMDKDSYNNVAIYADTTNFVCANNICYGGGHSPIACSSANNGVIANNRCIWGIIDAPPANEGGIELEAKPQNDFTSHDIVCSNNHVEGYYFGIMVFKRDVTAINPYNMKITGNYIKNCTDRNITVTSEAYNIEVHDNTIIAELGNYCIGFNGNYGTITNNHIITSNSISNSAIFVSGATSSNITINNNKIDGTGLAIENYAININVAQDNIKIMNNVISNCENGINLNIASYLHNNLFENVSNKYLGSVSVPHNQFEDTLDMTGNAITNFDTMQNNTQNYDTYYDDYRIRLSERETLTNKDFKMLLSAGYNDAKAGIWLHTGGDGGNQYEDTAAKCALIADGNSESFSRSNFHICLNNIAANNAIDANVATVSDAVLSCNPDGTVHIPRNNLNMNNNSITNVNTITADNYVGLGDDILYSTSLASINTGNTFRWCKLFTLPATLRESIASIRMKFNLSYTRYIDSYRTGSLSGELVIIGNYSSVSVDTNRSYTIFTNTSLNDTYHGFITPEFYAEIVSRQLIVYCKFSKTADGNQPFRLRMFYNILPAFNVSDTNKIDFHNEFDNMDTDPATVNDFTEIVSINEYNYVNNINYGRSVVIDGQAESDIDANTPEFMPILRLMQGQSQGNPENGAQISFGYNGTNTFQHFITTVHNSIEFDNKLVIWTCNGTTNNSVQSGSNKIFSYGTPASVSHKNLSMDGNHIIDASSIEYVIGTLSGQRNTYSGSWLGYQEADTWYIALGIVDDSISKTAGSITIDFSGREADINDKAACSVSVTWRTRASSTTGSDRFAIYGTKMTGSFDCVPATFVDTTDSTNYIGIRVNAGVRCGCSFHGIVSGQFKPKWIESVSNVITSFGAIIDTVEYNANVDLQDNNITGVNNIGLTSGTITHTASADNDIANVSYVQSWMPPVLEETDGVARMEIVTLNDPVFGNACNTLSNGTGNSGRLAFASDGSIRMVFGKASGFYLDANGGAGSLYHSTSGGTSVANLTVQANDTLFNKDINMDTDHKIINVADPVNPQDVATKEYVDTNDRILKDSSDNTIIDARDGDIETTQFTKLVQYFDTPQTGENTDSVWKNTITGLTFDWLGLNTDTEFYIKLSDMSLSDDTGRTSGFVQLQISGRARDGDAKNAGVIDVVWRTPNANNGPTYEGSITRCIFRDIEVSLISGIVDGIRDIYVKFNVTDFNFRGVITLNGTIGGNYIPERTLTIPTSQETLNSLTYEIKTELDLNGNQITNVADPVNPQDVTTKNYIDTFEPAGITSGNAGISVEQSTNEFGGTETYNTLTVDENLNSGRFAIKNGGVVKFSFGETGYTFNGNGNGTAGSPDGYFYWDAGDTNYNMRISTGDTKFGKRVDLESNNITNVADPINPQDVATKAYVHASSKNNNSVSIAIASDNAGSTLDTLDFAQNPLAWVFYNLLNINASFDQNETVAFGTADPAIINPVDVALIEYGYQTFTNSAEVATYASDVIAYAKGVNAKKVLLLEPVPIGSAQWALINELNLAIYKETVADVKLIYVAQMATVVDGNITNAIELFDDYANASELSVRGARAIADVFVDYFKEYTFSAIPRIMQTNLFTGQTATLTEDQGTITASDVNSTFLRNMPARQIEVSGTSTIANSRVFEWTIIGNNAGLTAGDIIDVEIVVICTSLTNMYYPRIEVSGGTDTRIAEFGNAGANNQANGDETFFLRQSIEYDTEIAIRVSAFSGAVDAYSGTFEIALAGAFSN